MDKKRISFETLYDKVLGGWIGKSLGGIVGAPVECHRVLGSFNTENCWPDTLFPNDDLDIQVVWLELLEEYGSRVTSKDMADVWQDRCWYNFSEYGFFLYNRQRGIEPPLSGVLDNWFCKECMGCPIRSEIWGMYAAGNPQLAAETAGHDGELDHTGVSVEAERFFAAAEAEAFFADDLSACLEAGLSVLEEDSELRGIYGNVVDAFRKYGSAKEAHLPLVRRYGHRDYSKTEINFAFTLLALLEGGCDMKKTIVTAINCGWDSDCTAATAGALLGILKGTACCPSDWREKMGDRLSCDVNVRHKTALLTDFAYDTCVVIAEASRTVNDRLEITDLPVNTEREVEKRIASRKSGGAVSLTAAYPAGPAVCPGKTAKVNILIENKGEPFDGAAVAEAQSGFEVKCPINLHVPHGKSGVELECRFLVSGEMRDKNTATFRLLRDGKEYASVFFGLIGARPWTVYGPYFDIYDRKKFSENPYRNDKVISHPNNIPGNFEVMVHNYVYPDREYLDEKALLAGDIEEERPFLLLTEEDQIGAPCPFTGEAVYYIVREVRCERDYDCLAVFSRTAPVKIWADGKLLYEDASEATYGLLDVRLPVSFTAGRPMRFVVKTTCRSDGQKLSLFFVKHFTEDKTKGVSFLLDEMTYILPSIKTENLLD